MELINTAIPGCYEIGLNDFEDDRGLFFKTFHVDFFRSKGLETNWKEEYFSNSKKNVIRGMHFQMPPKEHSKLVTCLSGAVLDVVLDLRKNSPMYMKSASFYLDSKNKKRMIYIPKGCAHGFLSLKDNSLLHYKVSTIYDPDKDEGILWDGFGFNWDVNNPIVSKRDHEHLRLNEFKSPF